MPCPRAADRPSLTPCSPRNVPGWLRALGWLLLLASAPAAGWAVSLAEHARAHPPALFVAKKGAVMPNPYDSPGHLKEGTRALLLSGLGLTDLQGIASLMVELEGRRVPLTSVPGLYLYVRNNPLTTLPAGFATMRATIDITGTQIDPAKLSPELCARLGTEKPPGSKDPDAVVVSKPDKQDKVKPAKPGKP